MDWFSNRMGRQRKEPVDLKIEKYKFPNLDNQKKNNRKKGAKPQAAWGHNKSSNICVIPVPKEEIVAWG